MKETDFIEKNKQKWHEFEKLSKGKSKDPDKLSELFIELTEDLSYAKTFYPKRSVRVYLNYLAQQIFISFNKRKRRKMVSNNVSIASTTISISLSVFFAFLIFRNFDSYHGGMLTLFWILSSGIFFLVPRLLGLRMFFVKTLPLELYRSRKQLLISFLFFAVAVLIGAVSSYIDPDFSRVILGNDYVDMTEANINKQDPMAVYKQMDEGSMFMMITINNIQVAFFTFILGAFFSVGSVFMLLRNGFMLGAFQHFFYTKGLFLTSFLTIWIHGTLEISAIIIAGAAGIVMGNGLLFPKTLTRTQSLQIHARRGINIMLGTVPIFIVAGFLEGYVTRHTEMPAALKWFIILSSLAFILFYFVYYPIRVGRKEAKDTVIEEKPVHIEYKPLKKHAIRDLGNIFYDSFRFYKLYISKFSKPILLIIAPLILVYLGVLFNFSPYADYLLEVPEVAGLALSTQTTFSWIGFVANVIFFSLNIATVVHCISSIGKEDTGNYMKKWFKEIGPYFLKAIPIIAAIYAFMFYVPTGFVWLAVFLCPFVVLVFYPAISNEYSFGKGIGKGMGYGSKDWGLTFITFLIMTGLAYLFSWSYHNPMIPGLDLKTAIIDEIVNWHTITVFDNFLTIKNFISAFCILLLIQFLLPLLIAAFSFQFLSIKDKQEAIGLNERIKSFGTRSKVYEGRNG
ncbi:MAG: stage II sporulation protein M [Flavobacteriales bacterium]